MILKNHGIGKVYIFVFSFLLLFILNFFVPISILGLNSYTSRMWVIFQIFVSTLAIFILVKEKLPSKKIIVISLILGVLSGLLNPSVGITTIITFMASWKIFEKNDNAIPIVKHFNTKALFISIGIGIAVGLLLGIVNLILSGNQTMNFQLDIFYFLHSLNPAIFEEVSFRLFMYAFTIYLLNGKITNKIEKFLSYFLMIIPHVLIHMPDMFFKNGVFNLDIGSFLVNLIMLSIIFGLPFTLLQRKRDLLSAMIAHGLVDFIRFCFLGLPV